MYARRDKSTASHGRSTPAADADGGHNWLFYLVVHGLRRRIAVGEFGEILGVEVTFAGEGRSDETYRGDWVFDPMEQVREDPRT